MMTKMRGMANDFQKQFNEALKEAELDDVKKSVDSLRGLNPAAEIRKQLNPFEKAASDVRSGLDDMMKSKPADTSTPAVAEAQAAEPIKNGATIPGGPDTMPPPPTFPAMTDASVPTPAPASAPATAKSTPKPANAPKAAKAASAKPAAPAPVKATKAPSKPATVKTAKSAGEKPAPSEKAAKPAARSAKNPARAPK
jgi:sec-independent protein translocase protein TatB